MAGSNSSDGDGLSPAALVTSILGLNGPLRLRAHGSTQKPHIILRRVESAGLLSNGGDVNHVVRFSLFAQKRIDVKPGKEILLCVATENGGFKDIPLVFECGPTNLDTNIDPASEPPAEEQVEEEEDEEEVYSPPVRHTVPPKMRRTWTKAIEETSIAAKPAPTRVSIGIQASPELTSRAVEAVPVGRSVSIQAIPTTASVSTQAVAPSSPASVQTQPNVTSMSTQTMTPEVQVSEMSLVPPVVRKSKDLSTDGEAEMDLSDNGQRSLSPMELDSDSDASSAASTPITSYFPSLPTTQSSHGESPSPIRKGDDPHRSNTPTGHSGQERIHVSPLPPSPYHRPMILENPYGSMRPNSSPGGPHTPSNITGDHVEKQTLIGNVSAKRGRTTSIPSTPQSLKQEPEEPVLPPHTKPKRTGIYDMFIPAKLATGPSNSLDTIALGITVVNPEDTKGPKIASSAPTPKTVEAYVQSEAPKSQAGPKPPTSQTKLPPAPPTCPKSMMIAGPSPPFIPLAVARPAFGATVNPLNIAPSTSRKPVSSKPLPAGPRSLQNMALKRPIVIGSGWSAGKGLASLTSVELAEPRTVRKKIKRGEAGEGQSPLNGSQENVVAGTSQGPPSPPQPLPPPPPPPSEPTLSALSTSKWKPVAVNDSVKTAQSGSTSSNEPTLPTTIGLDHSRSRLAEVFSVPSPSSPTDSAPHSPGFTDHSRSSGSSIRTAGRGGSSKASTPTRAAASKVPDFTSISSLPKDLPPHLKKSASAKTSNRAQLSEIFDLTFSPPPSVHHLESASTLRRSSSATTLPAPSLPMTHPLPAKPTVTSSNRGVKRERPHSPDLSTYWRDNRTPPRPRSRVRVNFPTVQSTVTKVLQGEGQPSVQTIDFSSDGSTFLLSCSDRTIRVWKARERVELARLTHHSPIINTFWLENDAGVIVLTDDGMVSKWTKSGENAWKWAKVLDAGSDYRSEQDPICFAYTRDRIAVSFPRLGVRVWIWTKGIWQPQRSILRQNVTAIKFIDEGAALLGGTRDGALWYCETPNGTLRAYAFFKTKIISIDVSPLGTHVLVGAAAGGGASLVALRKTENKGHVEKIFSCKDRDAWSNLEFGAAFATKGQAVLFASIESCVLVWDRQKGNVVYGLEHDEDDCIQAVAAVDSISGREGCMVTGTRKGQLCWWSLPVAAGQSQGEDSQKKKQKVDTT